MSVQGGNQYDTSYLWSLVGLYKLNTTISKILMKYTTKTCNYYVKYAFEIVKLHLKL